MPSTSLSQCQYVVQKQEFILYSALFPTVYRHFIRVHETRQDADHLGFPTLTLLTLGVKLLQVAVLYIVGCLAAPRSSTH